MKITKILKVLTVTMLMMLLLAACGSKEQATEVSTQENVTATTTSSREEPTIVEETKNNSFLEVTYKVPMHDIYIDAPNYQEIEQGYTELFIIHESKYVAITIHHDALANTSKEAHDVSFEKFTQNMKNYEGGVNSINISKDETTTINGLEVYGFEGTINYGRDNIHDGYAKGYSFVMDGLPCEIIGSVTDESQSQELIDEISEIVTQMMESVRSKQ